VLAEGTEKAIYAAYQVLAEDRPTPKELERTLQTQGHKVDKRTIQRRFKMFGEANAAHAATSGAQRWRLTDAQSAEELALILPAVARSAEQGRELSKDEAAIFLAFRRALPTRHPDFLLYLTHHYDRARRADERPWTLYTVDEIEEWVAFAHLDEEQPGALEKATETGQVRKIGGWVVVGSSLANSLIHTCGRKFFTNENYARHAKDCDGTPVTTEQSTSKRKGGKGHG